MNTLVIFQVADPKRVLHFEQNASLIPTLSSDDTSRWSIDGTTADFQVGVVNYDPAIFDSTTRELTDTACTLLGILTEDKSRYKQDLSIEVPVELVEDTLDLVVLLDAADLISGLSLNLRPVSERSPYVNVDQITGGNGWSFASDPLGETTLNPYDPDSTEYVNVTVQKYDADGTALTDSTDDDKVFFRVSHGSILGNYYQNLVNGSATFYWRPSPGSYRATLNIEPGGEVYAPGMELRPGATDVLLGPYSAPGP